METRPGAAQHDGGAGQPGQPLVTQGAGGIAPPPIVFQAHWRCAVSPGQHDCQSTGGKAPGSHQGGPQQGQHRPGYRNAQAPAARHAARRDRALRFVDGVDMAVKPVIDSLAAGTDQGAREHKAQQQQPPLLTQVLARGHHATGKSPHGWKPGDGFEEFSHRAQRRTRAWGREGEGRGVHAPIVERVFKMSTRVDTKCQPGASQFSGFRPQPRPPCRIGAV